VALTDQRPNQPTLLETSLGIEDVSLGYRDRADHRHRWVFDVLAPPRALDALRYLSLVHDAIDILLGAIGYITVCKRVYGSDACELKFVARGHVNHFDLDLVGRRLMLCCRRPLRDDTAFISLHLRWVRRHTRKRDRNGSQRGDQLQVHCSTPPQHKRMAVERVFAGWLWLQNEGLLVPAPDQPNGFFCLARKGARLRSKADLEAYRQGNLLPLASLQRSRRKLDLFSCAVTMKSPFFRHSRKWRWL